MPGPDNLLARIADDIEEFKLRNPLRPVVVDGLLDQRGNLLEIDRVLLHALGDGALGEARDHVGLGRRRGLLADGFVEGLLVEDIDRRRERDDLIGVNMLVEKLAHPLFVELEIDVFLIALADGGAQLLETTQIILVGRDGGLIARIVDPIGGRERNCKGARELRQALVEVFAALLVA